MNTNVEEKVKKIFTENLVEFDIGEIDLNQNLIEQGVNSIIFIKVVIAIEKEFGFEFGDKDLNLDNFLNLDKLVDYVAKRVKD